MSVMTTRRSVRRARQLFPTRADLLYEAEGQRIQARLARDQATAARRHGERHRAQALSALARRFDEGARFYTVLARTS